MLEFLAIEKTISKFFDVDSSLVPEDVELLDIEKIIVLKNEKLEKRFIDQFNQFFARNDGRPCDTTNDDLTYEWLHNYVDKISGNRNLNLVLGWEGYPCASKTVFQIAELGHVGTLPGVKERTLAGFQSGVFYSPKPSENGKQTLPVSTCRTRTLFLVFGSPR